MLTINNNLSTTHTVIRKPNMSTLKPSRKKTKLNVLMEPSVPLTSSRFTVYDTQMNALTGATSSSSNQTTPRSIRPLGQQQQQQQVKLKSKTQLAHYPNPEQIRAHVNRSVLERQQPTNLVAATSRGLIQQIIPFDASPSKFNNLLLRHCIQQQQQQPQVNTIYHPSKKVFIEIRSEWFFFQQNSYLKMFLMISIFTISFKRRRIIYLTSKIPIYLINYKLYEIKDIEIVTVIKRIIY